VLHPFSHVTLVGNENNPVCDDELQHKICRLYHKHPKTERYIDDGLKYFRVGKTEVTCRTDHIEDVDFAIAHAEVIVDQYNPNITIPDIAEAVFTLSRDLDGRPVELEFCGAQISFAASLKANNSGDLRALLRAAAKNASEGACGVVDLGHFRHGRAAALPRF
jgi:hypothetical protein